MTHGTRRKVFGVLMTITLVGSIGGCSRYGQERAMRAHEPVVLVAEPVTLADVPLD